MSAPLRAGVIGLGAMGRNHARVLSTLEGVELVAVADPVATDPRASHGAPIVAGVAELLARGLDYAVVACPTALHEEVGLQLAEAGVGALIEKPLAHTVEAAQRLRAAFESAGLPAGVGHIERYNPSLQRLRDRLAAGELGEVYQVITRRQGPFPARIADVGVVKDLATHDIDLTAWVTGQDYASVSARTSRRSGREHEDMVAVVGELTDGTIVNHLVNWLSPFKERATVVTGERGSFVADTLNADLTFYANGVVASEWETARSFRGVSEGDMTRFAIARREPLLVEHERFRDAFLGDHNDIVTLAQGLRTVEVADAVLRSASTGGTVSVERAGGTVSVERAGAGAYPGSRPGTSAAPQPTSPDVTRERGAPMLEASVIEGTNVVSVTADGAIAADEETAVRQTIDRVVAEKSSARMLLDYGGVDVGRVEPKAVVEDLKATRLLDDIERVGVVTDSDVLAKLLSAIDKVPGPDIRTFDQRDDAVAWLTD